MSIIERTMYVGKCDNCGALAETDEYVAWTDAQSALEAATDWERGNWSCQENGDLFCFECRVNAGDLRDDEAMAE